MRINIYDSNPGAGVGQWFLKVSWFLGCFFQKLFGVIDDYYGYSSWPVAQASLPAGITQLQYWGHGSPGRIWMAGRAITAQDLLVLKDKLAPGALVWFRTCSAFQGDRGHLFAKTLADGLGCRVAGHTRIIGLFQGGLHSLAPAQAPSWPATEGEFPPSFWRSLGLKWGSNTVTCFAVKVPEGW